ncbi:hypothetical protein QFZ76_001726 [Streptomyces sp. V4I2]|nr:hypothetical protein [Streptomyces sp. V4I2]
MRGRPDGWSSRWTAVRFPRRRRTSSRPRARRPVSRDRCSWSTPSSTARVWKLVVGALPAAAPAGRGRGGRRTYGPRPALGRGPGVGRPAARGAAAEPGPGRRHDVPAGTGCPSRGTPRAVVLHRRQSAGPVPVPVPGGGGRRPTGRGRDTSGGRLGTRPGRDRDTAAATRGRSPEPGPSHGAGGVRPDRCSCCSPGPSAPTIAVWATRMPSGSNFSCSRRAYATSAQ